MRARIEYGVHLLLLSLSLSFTGCMRQAPQGGYESGGGGLFNSGTSSVLGGGVEKAGGSGAGGALTAADTSSLKNVISAADALKNDPNAQKLGIDSTISAELLNEINRVLAQEREGQNVVTQKWLLVPKILDQCQAKLKPLYPIQGQPLIGEWTGSGACGLQAFSINGPGADFIYPGSIPGAQDVKVAAYNDGRFELRSNKWNGNGKDSGFNGQNLSGVGTLNTQIPSTTKYGTTYTPCAAQVKLVTSRNPIPANYQTALRVMGDCYRKAMGLLGMDAIFKNMDPNLANALLQQMLK